MASQLKCDSHEPVVDNVPAQHSGLPGLLCITPGVGGLILLAWNPAVAGLLAAFLWAGFALALATATFLIVRSRLHSLLPGLDRAGLSEITRAILAPMWIAESIRMAIAAGSGYAFKFNEMMTFRIVSLAEWLGNPLELLTGLGLVMMVMRMRKEFNRANSAYSNSSVGFVSLVIAALFCVTYALTGVAALIAMASTMTIGF